MVAQAGEERSRLRRLRRELRCQGLPPFQALEGFRIARWQSRIRLFSFWTGAFMPFFKQKGADMASCVANEPWFGIGECNDLNAKLS